MNVEAFLLGGFWAPGLSGAPVRPVAAHVAAIRYLANNAVMDVNYFCLGGRTVGSHSFRTSWGTMIKPFWLDCCLALSLSLPSLIQAWAHGVTTMKFGIGVRPKTV